MENFVFQAAGNGELTIWFKQEGAGFPGSEKNQWINLALAAGNGQVKFYKNGESVHEVAMADTSITFD